MFIETKKQSIVKFWEYALYIFFAVFPFFIFNNFIYQGTSSRFLILCFLVSVLIIPLGIHLLQSKSQVKVLNSPILWFFGGYLVYLFISALLGVDFSVSFWSRAERTSGLFYLTHLAFFTIVLVQLFSFEKIKNNLLKVVVYTSTIYSLSSLLGPQGFGLIFKSNPYDGFMFGNSSFAAMYLLGAFLLSLYYLFTKQVKEIKWYEYTLPFLIICNPFFINLLGEYSGVFSILGIAQASSIAFFTSLIALVGSFLVSRIQHVQIKKFVTIGIFVVSLVVLAFGMKSLLSDEGRVRAFYQDHSSLARLLVWDISKQAIAEKPITGWGGDNFTVAFQENFDARLLTPEYNNEAWFDRSHNIVLDQTVDGGYVGVILYFSLYLVLFGSLLYVLLKTNKRENSVLATILSIYFFVHILELQTAFDTTISAVMVSFMVALTVYVLYDTRKELGFEDLKNIKPALGVIFGVIAVVYFSWALLFGTFPFLRTQIANGDLRTVGSSEKRIHIYPKLFSAKVDLAGVLWKTSVDFQKGIAENPKILENKSSVDFLFKEIEIITKAHEEYVLKNPETFRVRLGLADLYIYQMIFGVNRLDDAERILDEAIQLSDKHPQPYWMKAVVSLYRRDFISARKYVEIAKTMSENSVETQRLEKYIENSIQTFPEIGLYFFNQI